jgi:hypothetical protein
MTFSVIHYSLMKITEHLRLGINRSHFYEEQQTNQSAAT